MNADLKKLFDQDRADHAKPRIAGNREYDELRRRDALRREQVRSILSDEITLDCIDLYHAAWILNHGGDVADAELAHRLAEQSFNAGYEPAKWLYAAAFDRACMYRGECQRFGTQIVPDGNRYRLWDVDSATTDDQRKQYNVPPLAEMKLRASEESRTMAQPPMEFAPEWLKEAIDRWNQELDSGR